MASSFTLSATTGYSPVGWSFPAYVAGTNGWAYLPRRAINNDLIATGFLPTMPYDCTIVDLQVTLTAYYRNPAGVTTPTLNVQLISPDGTKVYTQPISFTVASTGATTYTVGGTGGALATWGYAFKRFEIDQNYIAVKIFATQNNLVDYNVQNVQITAYYNTASYLVGSRSVFSERSNPLYDNFPNVANGYGLEHQIKSFDVNKLGDALYNIEYALLNRSAQMPISVIGNKGTDMYVMSATITGAIVTSNLLQVNITKVKSVLSGLNYENSPNGINSILMTMPPDIPVTTLNFNYLQGIAWVTPATGANIPLIVSPSAFHIKQYASGKQDVYLSVTLNPEDIAVQTLGFGISPIYFANTGWLGYYTNTLVHDTVPTGNLTLKLFGIANTGDA